MYPLSSLAEVEQFDLATARVVRRLIITPELVTPAATLSQLTHERLRQPQEEDGQ